MLFRIVPSPQSLQNTQISISFLIVVTENVTKSSMYSFCWRPPQLAFSWRNHDLSLSVHVVQQITWYSNLLPSTRCFFTAHTETYGVFKLFQKFRFSSVPTCLHLRRVEFHLSSASISSYVFTKYSHRTFLFPRPCAGHLYFCSSSTILSQYSLDPAFF